MSTLTDSRFPDIDYDCRPSSYWDAEDPLAAILRDVKGTNRRQMIRDYWEAGKLDELTPELLGAEVDAALRESLGALHPSFMGGEYLPGYLPFETEIARVELESTLRDVTSIRARLTGEGGIRYRIVNEYDTTFHCAPEASQEPLTLGELVRLIDHVEADEWDEGGSLALCYNEGNLSGGTEAGDYRHFTTVSSEVYTELLDHYDRIHELWVQSCEGKRAER